MLRELTARAWCSGVLISHFPLAGRGAAALTGTVLSDCVAAPTLLSVSGQVTQGAGVARVESARGNGLRQQQ